MKQHNSTTFYIDDFLSYNKKCIMLEKISIFAS